MNTLLDQAIREVNSDLHRFNEAHKYYTIFLGGTLVSTAALLTILLAQGLANSESLLGGAVVGATLLLFGLAIGLWWRSRMYALYREISLRCRELEKVGYVLHKSSVGLRNELAATNRDRLGPTDEVLNFETLDAQQLHSKMI